MKLDRLDQAVAEDAALRRRQTLQPVGGRGDKIFPPTYPSEVRNAPPRHVYELRQIDGEKPWCVLVDSVQSQANRLEEALVEALAEGLSIPHVVVNFEESSLEGLRAITSLEAPHRVYDAIMRDSLLDGMPFMSTEVGHRLIKATQEDATALLEVSPTALIFGAWHSTGSGGGLGAKFARCLVSEIVGVDVPGETYETSQRITEYRTFGRRPGSRLDPLGTSREVRIYQSAETPSDWTPNEEKAARDKSGSPVLFTRKKGDKVGRPSVINHGNIPPTVQPLGVTCDRLEHSFVLSFAALRRLRFGGGARDRAGRTFLASLGLLALTEQDARGYALRSRCDLVCDGRAPLELVHPDGSTDEVELDQDGARTLYSEAYEAARKAGFDLASEPLRLVPQDKLVEIVRRSQALALAGKGGADEEDDEG